MTIEFLITFIIFSIGANGLGHLFLYLIRPNQLFSFIDTFNIRFKDKNVFIYKSLGGCEICTIQRFVELSYLFLIYLYHGNFNNWLFLPLYLIYSGISFLFIVMKIKEKKDVKIVNEKVSL